MATIASQRSSNALRDISESQIDALREGDCELLPYLLAQPQAVHRLPTHLRQALIVALLSVIGDSRSAFTSGVKKESSVAMRIMCNLVSAPSSLESASELKLMLRTLGSDELKKLKLDRHLLSQKEDVGPAAIEFVKTMIHVLRCDASDFISNQAALTKVEQAIQSIRTGASARTDSSSRLPPEGGGPSTPSAGEGTSGGGTGAGGGGGGGAHRVRSLPSKPSSVPHEQNPMYDANTECGLMNINTPNPVLMFAKHFGLGCIPRIPRYTEGTSLVLAVRRPTQSGTEDATNGATASGNDGTGNTQELPRRPLGFGNHVLERQASTVTSATTVNETSTLSVQTPTLGGSPRPAPTGPPTIPSSPPRPPSFASSNTAAQPQPPQATSPPPTLTSPTLSSTRLSPPPAMQSSATMEVQPAPPVVSPRAFVVPPPLEPGTPSFELLKRYTSNDGVLVGWGQNRCGELGFGNMNPVLTPRVLPISTKILQVSCGAQYSVLLTKTGQALACGAAEWGQLGVGDPSKLTESTDGIPVATTPMPVKGFKSQDVVSDICTGYAFAVAVTENGEMYLWGNNNHGQCSLGSQLKPENVRVVQPMKVGMRSTRIVSVACGSFFVVVLTATSTVLSWGLVSVLGLGQEEDVLRSVDRKWSAESLSREKRNIVLCPCKVSALDGKGVVQVCAGQWHVIAVCRDGAVYSWGVGHQGRLGHGVASQESKPRRIEGLRDVTVVQASCGSFHSCVLSNDGRVFVFGDNANGQCGLGGQPFYLSPALLPLPARATYVGCGREQTTVLLEDGDVMVCGSSIATGTGLGNGSKFLAPTRILTNFISLGISCGINHSFSLAVPRALELIPVGMLHAGPPSKITSMMLKDGLISAALGASFTVVVNRNGETFAFGNGDWGQLGMGSPAALLEKSAVDNLPVILHPQRIPDLAQVRIAAVSAGYAFVFAISEQQKVYFWGNNNHSQGGLGPEMRNNIRIEVPTEVVALTDKAVTQIACGSFFVLALTASMEVYSWGIADCCGHGKDPLDAPPSAMATSTSSEARPVIAIPCKIQSLTNVVTIAAGQWHALALTDKGYIYAWGVGHQGRLGTGDTITRYTPTKLSFSVSCASIGCGSFHSWAITTSSDLYMWGDNDSGQCGSDRTDTILFPQQVASDVRHVSCGRQHSVLITNDGKVRLAGLLAHQDKQYKCKSFDAQPQPPPLLGLQQVGKTALMSFSGPHHSFILAEKDRPSASVVKDAGNELRIVTKRANLSGNPIPATKANPTSSQAPS